MASGAQHASSRSSPAARARTAPAGRTPAPRWSRPSCRTRWARRGPACPRAAAGTRPGTRRGCRRWPGCRRRPAPAPAAARPAPRPAPALPAGLASPVRLTRNSAATSGSRTGTSRTWPGGQYGFWLVISTRPRPAGGRNACTDARSGALSNTSSHPAGNAASTPCTDATGSRVSSRSRAPSWAASSPNPAASTAGSSAANCQATPTSARCRCAYSTATLVFPAPPSPHKATIRGPSLTGRSAGHPAPPAAPPGRPATPAAAPATPAGPPPPAADTPPGRSPSHHGRPPRTRPEDPG